jgi:lysophospholipase L1-like esterase
LGDSLTPASQYEYWAAKQLEPGVKFRNCGVFGERTDQIAKRLDECARGADVMIIQGGINDLAQGRSPDSVATNLRRMVRSAKAMKLRVVLANVLPWNNGYPRAVPRINRLNELIDRIGREEHVAVADFYAALNDPRKPGVMPAKLTSDGNHPSIAGYRLLGKRLAPLLLRR